MGEIVCACREAAPDCEQKCSKWVGKEKPPQVFYVPAWPKIKPAEPVTKKPK